MTSSSLARPVQPPAAGSVGDGFIRFNLCLPVTRVGIGPFSFDPVEQFIGMKIADILDSLMAGPVTRRPSANGPAIEVYPLALPPGEGAFVPLGQFGELGFRNERGILLLTVPLMAAGWVRTRFGEAVLKGPVEGFSSDGCAKVAWFAVRIRPGMRAAIPVGALGEVGVEGG